MVCRPGDHTLVRARTFLHRHEAEIAKSALAAAGIECTIRVDDAGGMRPDLQGQGVDVLVRADQMEEAERVLTVR